MNKTTLNVSKFIVYSTVLFLLPFWILAYFSPMASMNIESIGLVPSETAQIVGLSNIRGSIGGLRLAIITLIVIGTYYEKKGYFASSSNFGWCCILWSLFKSCDRRMGINRFHYCYRRSYYSSFTTLH